MDRRRLLLHLRSRFLLDWHGIHGAAHWARVRSHGLWLASRTGADAEVVELGRSTSAYNQSLEQPTR